MRRKQQARTQARLLLRFLRNGKAWQSWRSRMQSLKRLIQKFLEWNCCTASQAPSTSCAHPRTRPFRDILILEDSGRDNMWMLMLGLEYLMSFQLEIRRRFNLTSLAWSRTPPLRQCRSTRCWWRLRRPRGRRLSTYHLWRWNVLRLLRPGLTVFRSPWRKRRSTNNDCAGQGEAGQGMFFLFQISPNLNYTTSKRFPNFHQQHLEKSNEMDLNLQNQSIAYQSLLLVLIKIKWFLSSSSLQVAGWDILFEILWESWLCAAKCWGHYQLGAVPFQGFLRGAASYCFNGPGINQVDHYQILRGWKVKK